MTTASTIATTVPPRPATTAAAAPKVSVTTLAHPAPKVTATSAARCHPSYQGACLPADVSDVDCAGGSGNGPAYTGRVQVVGPDVFDLDRAATASGVSEPAA